MAPEEIAKLVRETWRQTVPQFRVQALSQQRSLLSPGLWPNFDACVDLVLAGVEDSPQATTVVLIHGIRTDGRWQELVRQELGGLPNLNVVPAGYGFFSAIGLVGPVRWWPVRKIKRELRQIRRDEPQTKLVVVAHSFGTYIVSRILRSDPDIQFHKVVLCGSIIRQGFRWDTVPFDALHPPVLNDVGTKDWYPVLATAGTLGYGASGSLGFQNTRVRDRFFNYGHSDFFSADHIKKYWRPFIESGTVVDSEWGAKRPQAPYLMMLASSFPAGLVLLAGLALWLFA